MIGFHEGKQAQVAGGADAGGVAHASNKVLSILCTSNHQSALAGSTIKVRMMTRPRLLGRLLLALTLMSVSVICTLHVKPQATPSAGRETMKGSEPRKP